jgi:hypothetical protein
MKRIDWRRERRRWLEYFSGIKARLAFHCNRNFRFPMTGESPDKSSLARDAGHPRLASEIPLLRVSGEKIDQRHHRRWWMEGRISFMPVSGCAPHCATRFRCGTPLAVADRLH